MTNEQAKQEAIKKAWVELIGLESFSKITTDENGFIRFSNARELDKYNCSIIGDYQMTGYDPFKKVAYSNLQDCGVRPKSLQGLTNNNGWTRIEPDGSNLPIDKMGNYRVHNLNKKLVFNARYDWSEVVSRFKDGLITHYKPIKEEPLPLY